MKEVSVNLKKGLMTFHALSIVLAIISVFLFRASEKYHWIYELFLLAYVSSGAAILVIFFKTLGTFQKLYFELLFLAPFLLIAFWLFIKLFAYFLFG